MNILTITFFVNSFDWFFFDKSGEYGCDLGELISCTDYTINDDDAIQLSPKAAVGLSGVELAA